MTNAVITLNSISRSHLNNTSWFTELIIPMNSFDSVHNLAKHQVMGRGGSSCPMPFRTWRLPGSYGRKAGQNVVKVKPRVTGQNPVTFPHLTVGDVGNPEVHLAFC